MRITVNGELPAEAVQLTALSTARDVIKQSLQLFVRQKRQQQLRDARGFLKGVDTAINRGDDRC